MRVASEGNAGYNGGRNGDLYVVVHVKPSKEFMRQGFDIYSEIEISTPQAVVGDTIQINTIHGESNLTIPKGAQNGDTITLKGMGVPYIGSESQRGNHYVKINVKVPTKLTPYEEKLYKELFDLSKSSKGDEPNLLDRMKSALHK